MSVEFRAWPKIPRGQHEQITITEKMDGTNGCVVIEDGQIVGVQSRKRFINPLDDNYGFAQWVQDNEEELLKMGDGYHYGEWTGLGIQRNPHRLPDKRFYLFNTFRWGEHNPNTPACCHVVPVLYQGASSAENIYLTLEDLHDEAEGKYVPEGIIVYFHKTRRYEKHTFANTHGKWMNE